MFCHNCGNEINYQGDFCSSCGSKLEKEENDHIVQVEYIEKTNNEKYQKGTDQKPQKQTIHNIKLPDNLANLYIQNRKLAFNFLICTGKVIHFRENESEDYVPGSTVGATGYVVGNTVNITPITTRGYSVYSCWKTLELESQGETGLFHFDYSNIEVTKGDYVSIVYIWYEKKGYIVLVYNHNTKISYKVEKGACEGGKLNRSIPEILELMKHPKYKWDANLMKSCAFWLLFIVGGCYIAPLIMLPLIHIIILACIVGPSLFCASAIGASSSPLSSGGILLLYFIVYVYFISWLIYNRFYKNPYNKKILYKHLDKISASLNSYRF